MYQYTEFDRQFVKARANQYRDQLTRWQGARCPKTNSPAAPAKRLVCAALRAYANVKALSVEAAEQAVNDLDREHRYLQDTY